MKKQGCMPQMLAILGCGGARHRDRTSATTVSIPNDEVDIESKSVGIDKITWVL